MKVLIKRAKIMDKRSKHHGQKMDILIVDGVIEKIARSIAAANNVEVISSANLKVSIGWFDIGTHVGEPGLEHRETLETAVKAARSGGYTGFAPFPNVQPVLQQKTGVKSLIDFGKNSGFNIVPISAASIDAKGKELTEMYDLHTYGSKAFSDGLCSLDDGMMLNVLNYVKAFNGLVIHHPKNKVLSFDGHVHEGDVSTQLGLRGNPEMSETVKIQRDLALLDYTESNLCLHAISVGDSIKLIKEARKNSNVTSTVSYLNLVKIDEDVKDFDNNLKVKPPLRSKKDQKELWKGVLNDTVDAIVSNHFPLEEEAKKKEFLFADFGASGLETTFSAINTYQVKDDDQLNVVIEKLSHGPRAILKMKQPIIEVGEKADLTLFDNQVEWVFDNTKSKSANNPFLGQTLKGKVVATILGDEVYQNV